MTTTKEYMAELGQNARAAAKVIAAAGTGTKNLALTATADALNASRQAIADANKLDMDAGKANGLDDALLDRLELTPARIDGMIEGLLQVAGLPDPCGEITDMANRPSGIQVGKMRVALGVIGIIYESRPNVTIDAASLCLKSGNATILRGGSEAMHSNQAIAACIKNGLVAANLPDTVVQVVNTRDREAVGELITMDKFVDVIVPRGGKSLIERIANIATVPVIKHLDGICHVYIDSDADLNKAFDVALNAKTRRYGVCGAMETLLVAEDVAKDVLPRLAEAYLEHGVELRGCAKTCSLIANVKPATEEDWGTEYLGPILSVRILPGIDEAIDHINTYGSQHTDSIMTNDLAKSQRFLKEVDSSSVMVNASTQFADGFEYGLGAEIGISTNRIHVRGPVGLEGLTIQKWIVIGDGTIRP